MAIAPSRLGRFVSAEGFVETGTTSQPSDDVLVRRLREVGLARPDVPDDILRAVLEAARDEHASPSGR